MKHEFIVIAIFSAFVLLLIYIMENYLGETWIMAIVAVTLFIPLRIWVYRYRRSKGIKDPADDNSWF